jgi:quercetin dioxygenase-like cupin family protein
MTGIARDLGQPRQLKELAVEQELGPIGSYVLFENDAIRVWAVSVEPGSKHPWHRHLLPYVIVPVTGGEIEIESVDGTLRRPKEIIGQVVWRDAGEVHELRNVGASIYRNVLVEVKAASRFPA